MNRCKRAGQLLALAFVLTAGVACSDSAVEPETLPGVEPAGAVDDPIVTRPAPDKDCSDFPSQQAAQSYLESQTGDPDGLDRDGDGTACESL
jgi:hypothetical protein